MLALLKNIYQKTETIKGKKLLYLISIVFFVFLLLGILFGYITSLILNKNETINIDTSDQTTQTSKDEKTYEGTIRYVNPALYPNDKISYALVDGDGKEIILLKSADQKLAIAENLNVKVTGNLIKNADKTKDVLMVTKINIRNTSN